MFPSLKSKKIIKKYLIFILIILIAALSFWLIFLPVESSIKEVIFSVKKGEGSKEISLNLEKENLIRWAPMFRVYVLVKGIAGDLKAGEYILFPSMNIPEISEKFVKGDIVKINITIPEGFTVQQIEERLGLKLPGENLEGFLFPDTYQFSLGVSGEEVVEKMRNNFEKKLAQELREKIEKQGKTIFEIITMASMIEKEVRTSEDKKLVSGILWKRLKINMPLQVDATIVYILELEEDKSSSSATELSPRESEGKKEARLFDSAGARDFDEMRREVALGKDINSPYNTYRYPGLPLGPISNPGLESIIAAIEPLDSDYWYYLSAPDGEAYFSKTLKEHNIKKAEYLR